jgi:hypothetical protein
MLGFLRSLLFANHRHDWYFVPSLAFLVVCGLSKYQQIVMSRFQNRGLARGG